MTPSEGRRHTEKRPEFCRDNEQEEMKGIKRGLRAREGTRSVRSSRTDPDRVRPLPADGLMHATSGAGALAENGGKGIDCRWKNSPDNVVVRKLL